MLQESVNAPLVHLYALNAHRIQFVPYVIQLLIDSSLIPAANVQKDIMMLQHQLTIHANYVPIVVILVSQALNAVLATSTINVPTVLPLNYVYAQMDFMTIQLIQHVSHAQLIA